MATLKQRRLSDQRRQKRFREAQLAEGKRPVTAFISKKAQDVLNEKKTETGETNSAIIERAILNLRPKPQLRRKPKPQLKRRKAK